MSELQFAIATFPVVRAPPDANAPITQFVDNRSTNASDLENMNQPRSVETVAILGASPKPDRYAHKALQMLLEYGHRPLPVNPAFDEILGEKCYPTVTDAPGPIDTVTLYLGEARSNPLIDEIIGARPRRIIMNPGAENSALAAKAEAAGIEVVEGCTLVMLRTGQF
jgi:predicted CoA-binding protein